MDPISIGIGVLAVGYGLFTLVVRAQDPSRFGKLDAMKKMSGEKTGTLIHVISYTVIPIMVGIALIAAGVVGVPIFGK